jgi:hypothetical protein
MGGAGFSAPASCTTTARTGARGGAGAGSTRVVKSAATQHVYLGAARETTSAK